MGQTTPVIITIDSVITQEGQTENFQEKVDGVFDADENLLTYTSNNMRNFLYLNGSSVQLKLQNDTQLNFEHEETTDSLYSTPYGVIDIQIDSKEVESVVDGRSGDVKLDYVLKQNDNLLGEFRLIISFKPV